ncbi:MAG: monovalent cation/H(+) antiporter subunit G [Microcystaceae cyanobacterium]
MWIQILSSFCLAIGVWFGLWGTQSLLRRENSLLVQLHHLSVSDTLGSLSIIFGLWLLRPREWPLLLLDMISLALWNTILGYVLAYCATAQSSPQSHEKS